MTGAVAPESIGWSWAACFLGPIWYLAHEMLAKGLILLFVDLLTVGLAVPIVAIYSGIRGRSDLYERQLSQSSRISPKRL